MPDIDPKEKAVKAFAALVERELKLHKQLDYAVAQRDARQTSADRQAKDDCNAAIRAGYGRISGPHAIKTDQAIDAVVNVAREVDAEVSSMGAIPDDVATVVYSAKLALPACLARKLKAWPGMAGDVLMSDERAQWAAHFPELKLP